MICAHPVNLWITFLHPVFVAIREAEIALELELDLDFDNELDPRNPKKPSLQHYPDTNDSAVPTPLKRTISVI